MTSGVSSTPTRVSNTTSAGRILASDGRRRRRSNIAAPAANSMGSAGAREYALVCARHLTPCELRKLTLFTRGLCFGGVSAQRFEHRRVIPAPEESPLKRVVRTNNLHGDVCSHAIVKDEDNLSQHPLLGAKVGRVPQRANKVAQNADLSKNEEERSCH
jgi:hypothetical protein